MVTRDLQFSQPRCRRNPALTMHHKGRYEPATRAVGRRPARGEGVICSSVLGVTVGLLIVRVENQ